LLRFFAGAAACLSGSACWPGIVRRSPIATLVYGSILLALASVARLTWYLREMAIRLSPGLTVWTYSGAGVVCAAAITGLAGAGCGCVDAVET